MTLPGPSRLSYSSFLAGARSASPWQTEVAHADATRIVLIDPDRGFRGRLADYLRLNDLSVIEVDGFDTFYQRVGDRRDMVILMTLGADLAQGLGFLKFVGAKYRCPVLVLSDHADETARVLSLELGADDTIGKGTSPREVLARVRAAVRRVDHGRPDADVPARPREPAQGWRFLPGRRELIAPGGVRVPLTSAEYNLLNVMARNAGTPLDRDYLSRAVFGRVYSGMDRSVDNLVARLRRKLQDSARAPEVIKTARPIGYVFTGFPGTQDIGPVETRARVVQAASA
jgi:DNA-binding response OmpR family regulator